MSDAEGQPFSDNPNAPKIPFDLYFQEKANFAGILIGSILYGARKTPTRVSSCPMLTSFARNRNRVVFPVYGSTA